MTDLNHILQQAAEAGATCIGKKFQICQEQFLILGQAVEIIGRAPNIKRTNTIKQWPAPCNIKVARQFMGLCGTL